MAHRAVLRRTRRPAAARAAAIQLLLLDVDGVLTDGSILLGGDGSEAKRFHIRDGAAIVWAQAAGLRVGWLSSRPSPATTRRAAELRVEIVLQSAEPKLRAYEELLRRYDLTDRQVAYMGDDLVDLSVLARAGIAAAPSDAAAEVRSRVDFVTKARGGQGAVRELIEWLLRAQGRWQPIVAEWSSQGSR